MTKPATAFHYTGKGDYYPGVPARDLTDEDVAALDDEGRALVSALVIYRAAKPEKSEPPAKAAAKE